MEAKSQRDTCTPRSSRIQKVEAAYGPLTGLVSGCGRTTRRHEEGTDEPRGHHVRERPVTNRETLDDSTRVLRSGIPHRKQSGGCRGRGAGTGGRAAVRRGYRDEEALEVGKTAGRLCFTLLTCTLKNGSEGTFEMCLLPELNTQTGKRLRAQVGNRMLAGV